MTSWWCYTTKLASVVSSARGMSRWLAKNAWGSETLAGENFPQSFWKELFRCEAHAMARGGACLVCAPSSQYVDRGEGCSRSGIGNARVWGLSHSASRWQMHDFKMAPYDLLHSFLLFTYHQLQRVNA